MKPVVLGMNFDTTHEIRTISVRRCLRDLLVDGIVVYVNAIFRKILLNLIITSIRVFNIAEFYNGVWTKNGSPLRYHFNELVKKLQDIYFKDVDDCGDMRYRNPSLNHILAKIEKKPHTQGAVLPICLQNANPTTVLTAKKLIGLTCKWEVIPSVNFINNSVKEDSHINALATAL